MENKPKERRRNYFIKKEFQAKFIIKFCLLVILGTLISGTIVYVMSSATVTTTFENSRLKITSTSDFILPALFLASEVVIIAIGLATIIITLFTSHKIAGPLYRLEKDIERLSLGDLSVKFVLRQGDQLQGLRTGLMLLSKNLNTHFSETRKIVDGIESILQEKSREHSAEALKEIKGKIENLNTIVSRFRS